MSQSFHLCDVAYPIRTETFRNWGRGAAKLPSRSKPQWAREYQSTVLGDSNDEITLISKS